MAVAALRVAVGQLPPGTTQALVVALRPSPRGVQSASPPSPEIAAAALRMAASWLPLGTPKAAALAVASSVRERPAAQVHSQPNNAIAALVVAAQQQPQAWQLAAATGRALLRERRTDATLKALGVAAKQASPEVAAALKSLAGRVCRPSLRKPPSAGRRAASSLASTGCVRGASSASAITATCGWPHPLPQQTQKQQADGGLRSNHNQPRSHVREQLAVDQSFDAPVLCNDTSRRVIEILWPPRPGTRRHVPSTAQISSTSTEADMSSARISPRTFESRLREAGLILQDLQQVSAVSPTWAQRAEENGWPAAHAYLYQEVGTKSELRQRYKDSMHRLMVKDWLQRPEGVQISADGLVDHIAAFMP
eukprot:TRINITY_DN24587_c0_g1_i1.p1 TRINITY_DN24587_c0_g1~~TRINITY_DN24587_c0_g1_i1.p1  ORF type:complete len:366 (-),score=46.05 TRINITY_DN24587_c0_g1_i1:169-1266(-)